MTEPFSGIKEITGRGRAEKEAICLFPIPVVNFKDVSTMVDSNRSRGLNAIQEGQVLERFAKRDKRAPIYDVCLSIAIDLELDVHAVRRFVKWPSRGSGRRVAVRRRRSATHRRSSRGLASRIH